MHDATKVKLGLVLSSDRMLSHHESDAADTPAGFAVSLASDSTLSKVASDGMRIGISLGRSLSDTLQTVVCRAGSRVPLRLAKFATAKVTITSYANLVATSGDTLKIGATTFTFQSGSVTPGGATAQAATNNNSTAASLAAQINAHATASTKVVATAVGAVVYLVAVDAGADGEIALEYADTHSADIGLTVTGSLLSSGGMGDKLALFVPARGALAYIDSATGEACSSLSKNAVVSAAIYADGGALTGIDEDNVEVRACVVNMVGGL